MIKQFIIWGAPLLSFILFILMKSLGVDNAIIVVITATLLCALWWIFEPIPIPITSLIPLIVFNLSGVLSSTQIAQAYGHPLIAY